MKKVNFLIFYDSNDNKLQKTRKVYNILDHFQSRNACKCVRCSVHPTAECLYKRICKEFENGQRGRTYNIHKLVLQKLGTPLRSVFFCSLLKQYNRYTISISTFILKNRKSRPNSPNIQFFRCFLIWFTYLFFLWPITQELSRNVVTVRKKERNSKMVSAL